ncbi:MAG TPA: PDGLE domain-containing protein [Methanocorpusculum sp.]|nr:PDGLE domain-containing protein [Methanocorpusculum sp.]
MKKFLIAGIIIVLVIAGAAVLFASANPDGLDSTFLIAEGQKEVFAPATGDEISGEELDPVMWNAPMPDYALGEEGSPVGGMVAVIIGVIVALGAIVAIAFAAMKSRTKKE